MSILPVFQRFDVHADSNAGPRWKKWLPRFERLMVAMDISNEARKRALLLHYAGTGDENNYKSAVEALTKYFNPRRNKAYEVYKFRQVKQEKKETLDTYHTRLRQLSQTCEFENVDNEIVAQIILSCQSQRLHRRALREIMTLEQLLTIGRSFETSEREADLVEAGRQEATNAISDDRGRHDRRSNPPTRRRRKQSKSKSQRSPSRQRQPEQLGQRNRTC